MAQVTKLFIVTEVTANEGSKPIVTHNVRGDEYKNSGVPSICINTSRDSLRTIYKARLTNMDS